MNSHARIAIGVLALALLAGAAALLYVRARMTPRFPYFAQSLDSADYARLAAQPGWTPVALDVDGGATLRGLLREPTSAAAPWLVFFNGNSNNLLREGQQLLDALCAEHGWGGVVWAYRGFDSSGGEPGPAVLVEDGVRSYRQLLEDRHLSPADVHLVGFSLGTTIASAVAARERDRPPASLVLMAPAGRLYMGDKLQLRLDHYETLRWLHSIASPVLVLHGRDDATLPIDNARRVAQALGPRATLLELPGRGHLDLLQATDAHEAIRAFVTARINGRGTSPSPAEPASRGGT